MLIYLTNYDAWGWRRHYVTRLAYCSPLCRRWLRGSLHCSWSCRMCLFSVSKSSFKVLQDPSRIKPDGCYEGQSNTKTRAAMASDCLTHYRLTNTRPPVWCLSVLSSQRGYDVGEGGGAYRSTGIQWSTNCRGLELWMIKTIGWWRLSAEDNETENDRPIIE